MDKLNYTNPRLALDVANWPYGRDRVLARFFIEGETGKQRAVRVTQSPNGRTNAPKKMTYAYKARIVDGSDGRTYIAKLTEYGHISIMRSDFKLQHEAIHNDDPRYNSLLNLFD